MSKVKQSSILKFIGGTVSNPTVAVTPLRQWEEDLNLGDLDDGRRGRKNCIEDDSQAPVNVSESHLASLEPAANHNVRNDEIPEKFHPPKTYKFPKRKFGSTVITERSFQPQWCDTYKWLHYDKVADAAFCHLCMRTQRGRKLLSSHRREPAFITSGFTNWKEANKGFSKHQSSECHKEAIEALCLLPAQIVGHVDELRSDEIKQQKVVNRKIFMKIWENTRYLACQGLPFHGYEDNSGNFIQVMKLRGLDCPQIEQWMKKKQILTYYMISKVKFWF